MRLEDFWLYGLRSVHVSDKFTSRYEIWLIAL